jgi:hypothetical protein
MDELTKHSEQIDKLSIGDLVLGTIWGDGSPRDGWIIGYVVSKVCIRGLNRAIVSYDPKSKYGLTCRRAMAINLERAKWLENHYIEIQLFTRSLWWWVRRNMKKTDEELRILKYGE